MNAENMGFKDRSFDVITALEVIEHIPDTEKVISELFRVARKYVILSVPSKEDNNPEHIHYFTDEKLNNYILKFQRDKKKIETVFVRGHMIKVIKVWFFKKVFAFWKKMFYKKINITGFVIWT